MSNKNIADLDVQSFPFRYTLSIIGGKWKMLILYTISSNTPIRYNELQRKIGKITYKTLSSQLKELEADGSLIRKEYPQIPPKVEYSLSDKGNSLLPVLDAICYWGSDHIPNDFKNQYTEKTKDCVIPGM
ncbi:MAG: winged helix-turn-helix transcriptional regulator [Coprobacillaceae bacterium]